MGHEETRQRLGGRRAEGNGNIYRWRRAAHGAVIARNIYLRRLRRSLIEINARSQHRW
jgi:hypothetical protein